MTESLKTPNITDFEGIESHGFGITKTSGEDRHAVAYDRHAYVRRLTPLERCRLQGFPDWWAQDLNIAEPTEADIDLWAEIFEVHRLATEPISKKTGKPTKPKSRNYIKKWLRDPQTDSAEYKMWGNSLAIPNALYVLYGVAVAIEDIRDIN